MNWEKKLHLTATDNKWCWFQGRIQGKPYGQGHLRILSIQQWKIWGHNGEKETCQNPSESNHLGAKPI